MHRTVALVIGMILLAGCSTTNEPPPPAPVAAAEPAAEPAPEPAAAPEPPPPPDAPPPQEKPQQTDQGRFRISVASLDTVEQTGPIVKRLQDAGYRTEVLAVDIDDKTWQRVLLPGYASLEDARAVIPFIEQEFGFKGVWVTSRRRAPLPDDAPGEPPAPEAKVEEKPAEAPAEEKPAN